MWLFWSKVFLHIALKFTQMVKDIIGWTEAVEQITTVITGIHKLIMFFLT